MTYVEALERLASLGPELRVGRAGRCDRHPQVFVGAHSLAAACSLDEPQKSFRSLLIAGTNGKGSTAATLASIATAAGIRTGLYTSPHLLRVNERIRVSDAGALQDIPDDAFGEVFERVDTKATELVASGDLPHTPSYFELMTAVAFCWFQQSSVELAVLEVGLGGRLDATNSVEPNRVGHHRHRIDHTEYLGNTLTEIAGEKAGILRENGVLVTLSQHPEANAAIGEKAMQLGVRGVDAARCLPGVRQGLGIREQGLGSPLARNRYELSIDGVVIEVDSPLAGQHQQRNIALALATAIELRTNHGFALSNAAIEAGIRATDWPGRLEWIPSAHGHAPLLLDVAHNPAGAWTLRAALAQLPDAMPRTLIFSCLRDKAIEEMAQVLLPLFDSTSGDPDRARDHVILAPIQNARAATWRNYLLQHTASMSRRTPRRIFRQRWLRHEAITPTSGIIVATGSVFLVGELRALAMEQNTALATNAATAR